MRKIEFICIHSTRTQPSAKVGDLLSYWRNKKGWRYPAYHRLIQTNGEVVYLLDFEFNSNGVKGYNDRSLHIGYMGGADQYGFSSDTRTEQQRAQLIHCIKEALHWCKVHQWSIPEIIGHRDLDPENPCPGFNAKRELSWVGI